MNTAMLIETLQRSGCSAMPRELSDRPAITIPVAELFGALRTLRDQAELQFSFLLTHTVIDWLEEDRF